MRRIFFVVADELDQFGVREQGKVQQSAPWFGVRFGVVDSDLHGHVPEVAALEALGGMEGVGVGMAIVIQPALVVETARLDDERIALPAADRVAEPAGLSIFGKRAAVRENLSRS